MVQLRITRLGQEGNLGFAIYANRDIKCQESIYELIGAMPVDAETPHSGLSAIDPHPDQDLADGDSRFLFGPARFINHLCKDFNVEVRSLLFGLYEVLNVLGFSLAVKKTVWLSMPMQSGTSKPEKKSPWTMGPTFLTNVPVPSAIPRNLIHRIVPKKWCLLEVRKK